MAITQFSTTPLSTDPANFSPRMDTRIIEQQRFVDEANALAAELNLNSTTDTSTSSVLIGLGAKTFTVTASKSFQPGMYLVIADTAAPSTNSMSVQVTSYIGTSLVVNCLAFRGAGTLAAWKISQSVGFTPLDTSVSPVKLSTGAPTWNAAGELTVVLPSLLGYGTGAGGVVTQLTSKATSVTINKPVGVISTSNSALAAGAETSFSVNNSLMSATDIIVVNGINPASYTIRNGIATAGVFAIFIKNTSAGSLSDVLTINFALFKGASA